jgi:hypothetical protein
MEGLIETINTLPLTRKEVERLQSILRNKTRALLRVERTKAMENAVENAIVPKDWLSRAVSYFEHVLKDESDGMTLKERIENHQFMCGCFMETIESHKLPALVLTFEEKEVGPNCDYIGLGNCWYEENPRFLNKHKFNKYHALTMAMCCEYCQFDDDDLNAMFLEEAHLFVPQLQVTLKEKYGFKRRRVEN